MRFKKQGDKVIFSNEIEDFYNNNEGYSNCIKNVSVASIYLGEE
ncbi:hypothetical protein [Clostridium sp. KNHs205]|nr:hypothetical protein [Clostridium sp. KNHs205]